MGQKINPRGLRVGVSQDWDAKWFAKDKDFSDLLIEEIDGEILLLDNVAIRISITQKVPAGIGDKVVLANQMKSIISGVLLNEVTTESGRKIDGLFSSRSCDARIVNSPFLMGAAASLLEFQGKIIANEFLS